MKFITAMFLLFMGSVGCTITGCPLQSVIPTQDVKEMKGKWYEYKKTQDFLASAVCTTFVVTCSEDRACLVNLNPNGTNTGLTNTLMSINTSTLWGENIIHLYVNTEKQYSILWNCTKYQTKYQVVVLLKNISDEDSIKELDEFLDDISKKYDFQTEAVNNTLCSGVRQFAVNSTAITIILIITIFS